MYAIIENGAVVNVVMWDGDTNTWQPPSGSTAVALPAGSTVGVGYIYANGVFTAPVTPN